MLESPLALPVIAELLVPSDRHAIKGASRVLNSSNKCLVCNRGFACSLGGIWVNRYYFHKKFIFLFHIRQACFFFLEFAFGAVGFGEKIKVEDYKNEAGIIFRYKNKL